MNQPSNQISDATIVKHITWCGIFVAVVAVMIAAVANSVG